MTCFFITTSALLAQGKFARSVEDMTGIEYYAGSVIQTTDGGYLVTRPIDLGLGDGTDCLVFKMNPSGNITWAQVIQGTRFDHSHCIVQTSDNGFAIVGETYSFGDENLFISKFNSSGDLQWYKTFGGDGYDQAHSAVLTADNGLVVAGFTSSSGAGSYDFFVLKTDANGNFMWAWTYGGTNQDIAHSIVQTTDGGFAVAGWTRSFTVGGSDLLILRLNSNGSPIWARTFGGSSDEEPGCPTAIIQTFDGGFVITGHTQSSGVGGHDLFVLKLASDGSLSWAKTIGGVNDDDGRSIMQTQDGDLVIAGGTKSFGIGGEDFFVVKLDASGNLLGARTFGTSSDDGANCIIPTQDGDLAIMGYVDQGFLLLKVDGNGDYPGCVSSCSPSINAWSPNTSSRSVGVNYIPSMGAASPVITAPTLIVTDLCAPLDARENEAAVLKDRITCSLVSGGLLFSLWEDIDLRIYGADGRLAYSGELKKGQTRIPLDPGVYLWQAGPYKGKAVVR
ncbi:MAG: hypothetical protein ABIM74_00855 [candidate division WOR-3 bacterium]